MKIHYVIIFLVFLIILPAALIGSVTYVPDDYGTIQDAIDNSINGDTVVVRRGTYTGADNKNLDFGGLSITVKGEGCPEETIINCQGSGRGFYFHSGEGANSVVEALTIKGDVNYSGGFRCENSSPTIRNCVIQCTGGMGINPDICGVYCDNSSPAISDCTITQMSRDYGAGIYCLDSDPEITNCTIKENYAERGGGIYCEYSNPTITDCAISDNGASVIPGTGYGGGIFCQNSSPMITNCEISGNNAGSWGSPIYLPGFGGGIWCGQSSNPWIENCVLSSNTACNDGGGMYCSASSPNIYNCTFSANITYLATSNGGGIYCANSSPTIKNCIMWDDISNGVSNEIYEDGTSTATVTYSDIEGGHIGIANINQDPLFVDGDGADNDPATWEDNDYHLKKNSPCIDSGHSTSAPSTDKEGWPRCDYPPAGPGGGVFPYYDMGAYEFRVFFYVNDSTGNDLSNGYTPTTAKKTIQAGINAATPGSVVMVAKGTYKGANNKDLNFSFGSIVVPLRSEEGPEVTIIDCEGSGRGFDLQFENDDVIVDGFTVTDADSSGIFLWASDMTVTNCIIIENSGADGGGIEILQCDPIISTCIIKNNTATSNGGGIYSRDSSPDLINCLITGNEASGNGGGIACCHDGGYLNAENCTIADNSAMGDGGGVYCLTSDPTFTNCILWNDSPDEIYVSSGTVTVEYSDVEGGYSGTGNIDQDPDFEDALSGDYHLKSGSPCIDAGTSNGAPTEDMEGRPRYDDPLTTNTGGGTYPYYDMGAFEFINDFYVNDATGSDCWDGLKPEWDDTHGPKKTIQGGIDAAVSGANVFVADGTYTGIGNRDIDFCDKSIALESENGPSVTIIDCQNAGQGLYIDSVEATVDGFTITNGSASDGAGIECWNSTLTITDCIITNNSASWIGGGIYGPHNPALWIDNCEISDNTAAWGGGMLCDDTTATISNCTISDNDALYDGGGIYWEFPGMTITDSVITGNTAGGNGGAMECRGDAVITNCVISHNTSGETGGGIDFVYCDNTIVTNCLINDNATTYTGGGIYCLGTQAVITNCTIADNSALSWSTMIFGGGGISCNSTSSFTTVVEVTNSILWSNLAFPNAGHEIAVWSTAWPSTLTVTYSDVEGGMFQAYVDPGCIFTWGAGNIDANPAFANPATDDYHLTLPSPCIDVGNNAAPNLLDVDLDGYHRIWFGKTSWTVDMGAYEYDSMKLEIVDMMKTVTGIELTWTSSGAAGVTYDVWYSDDPISESMSWAILQSGVPTGGATTTWTDTTSPLPGERYYMISY